MHISRFKISTLLIAALVLFILAFSFQGVRGVWEPDEGYYIGSAVSMDLQGSYLVPILGEDEIFLDKPPVLYWGILVGFKLFGHSEFAARFFTGLCYALTVIMIFAVEVSFSGRWTRAFWASVLYATMIIPFIAANFVTPDTPLTLFTTLSMLAFWHCVRPPKTKNAGWLIVLALAVGFGFLTKGPAALIPCGAMFIYLLLQKQVKQFFLTPWMPVAGLVFIAVGLGWYIYISWKLPDACRYFFDNMIWGRLVSEKYQRNPGPAGALIYIPVMLLGTMPWSVLWFMRRRGLGSFFHAERWRTILADPVSTFLACWVLIPMLVLCLASSKLGLYALPVFPAVALITVRLLYDDKQPAFTDTPVAPIRSVFNPPKISFLAVWLGGLLMLRLGLGAIPTANDCRALWHELKPHLPAGEYEIVTVDERASGLWFYGAREVENVTRRANPYPTFVPTENLQSEIDGMKRDQFPHLFLVQGKEHLSAIRNTLCRNGYPVKTIALRYGRDLLICTPPIKAFPFINKSFVSGNGEEQLKPKTISRKR